MARSDEDRALSMSRNVDQPLTSSLVKLVAPLLLAAAVYALAILVFPPPSSVGDAHHYLMTAQRLAYDGYFAYGEQPPGSDIPPNAKVTPGWPLVLAGVFALQGDSGDPVENAQRARPVIMTLMFLLSLSIVLAISLTGRLLGGENLGLLAGLMASLYLPFAWSGSVMLAEHLGAAVLAWALYCAVRLAAPHAERTYLGAGVLGVLCGLLVMARPNLALWAFVPLVFVAARRLESPARLLRLAAVGAIGFCLVFAPWWARNMLVLGTFVPVKSNYVPEWDSSAAISTTTDGPPPVPVDVEETSASASEPPAGWEYTSPWMVARRASVPWTPFFDVLWEETYGLEVHRIEYPHSRQPSVALGNGVSRFATLYHQLILVLALSSLLFVRRSPRLLILAAVPAAVLAIHWSHVTIRYLYPPMTAVVILAAVAAYAIYRAASRKLAENRS